MKENTKKKKLIVNAWQNGIVYDEFDYPYLELELDDEIAIPEDEIVM